MTTCDLTSSALSIDPQRFLRLHGGGDARLWLYTFLRRLALAVASFSERPWPESGAGWRRTRPCRRELDLRRLGFLRERSLALAYSL
jgi:hypothetical protein